MVATAVILLLNFELGIVKIIRQIDIKNET